jgi:hypothetical protein
MPLNNFLLFTVCLVITNIVYAQKNTNISKTDITLSAIKGTSSKPDTVVLSTSQGTIRIRDIKITGPDATFFKILSGKPKQVLSTHAEKIVIQFAPVSHYTGIAKATLEIDGTQLSVSLTGLSTKGLEGENEAPLSTIVEALGFQTKIGWDALANHWRPELQGDELAPALFRKASDAPVECIPVARYSPDFLLNFGYYTSTSSGPSQHQVGVLTKAGSYPEHQTLFPGLASGKKSFDPGKGVFGFYAISPTHTVYSEDNWNILFYPEHATHAMRIYPLKNKKGQALENTYLLCMEEAANGDYNDYVFVIKNITPVFLDEAFNSLFNGKNLDGWYTWLQGKGRNNDPDHIFTVEENGLIHDMGTTLGYIMTNQSFQNYHLILDFKWGEKKWPPRENNKRDSGICYNIPEDEPDSIWPQSVECQIQETDVGDFWLLGNSTIQVDGKQNAPTKYTQIVKKKDAEKPYGEWNTVEVISFNGKCTHIVNGVVVNYGENASLVGGRILLQSEYAEIFYRNIKIRKL